MEGLEFATTLYVKVLFGEAVVSLYEVTLMSVIVASSVWEEGVKLGVVPRWTSYFWKGAPLGPV